MSTFVCMSIPRDLSGQFCGCACISGHPEKNPIGSQRDVRKRIHAFLSINTIMDNQVIIVMQVIVIQVLTKLSYLCIALQFKKFSLHLWAVFLSKLLQQKVRDRIKRIKKLLHLVLLTAEGNNDGYRLFYIALKTSDIWPLTFINITYTSKVWGQ